MIVSLNWLKKFTTIDRPIDELATLIGARLVEIEEVVDLGAKYKGVVIARVMECDPLEGSDHLNVTKLDDGGKTENVERDANGWVQVVCGAPNVRKGITVAWLPSNTVVPETFASSEPFVLATRNLRGVVSNGMIASPRELALYDEHEGILELDDSQAPGESFADAYELNDYLLDIENKSLTHRPDTFGIIGFAREVAAIQGKAFHTPDWLMSPNANSNETSADVNNQNLTVTIDDPELCDRYMATVLSGADGNKKSPLHIQSYLARVGVRPINAVVDVTNYMMMLTGQPLHAFDFDKVVAIGEGRADIHVRAGRNTEKLKLLDGREITLTPEDIVIAAGEKAIALAGAMGGADTEIDENTKTIILESATFNLYNLRATQMRHGIFSEAITRFTKGQPGELAAPVLREAMRLLSDHAGARSMGPIIEAYLGKSMIEPIELKARTVNEILGSNLTVEDMIQTLKNVEFKVETSDSDNQSPNADSVLRTTYPYWRADIHIPEDIVEELGRLNGFDSIEPTLPLRDFTAVREDSFDTIRTRIRQILTRAGANEVLTYSFVHGDMLLRAAQKIEDSYKITNSISPNLQHYRQTLTPSLLGLVHPNIKQGYDEFALYELNKSHPKPHGVTKEGVPKEVDMLALVVTNKTHQPDAPFYKAKRILDYLGESLGLRLSYASIEADPNSPVTAPFEYRRSALVTDKNTGMFLGAIGEYKKSVARSFKLPEYAAGFEINTESVVEAVSKLPATYTPISRYPSTERDICFRVELGVAYGDIIAAAEQSLKESGLETTITPVDIYQPENTLTKNITIRIRLAPHDKTLTGEEAANIIDSVIASVEEQTRAITI